MELKEYVTVLQCDMTNVMEEVVLCEEAVESMSTQFKQVLMEWDEMVNTGAVMDVLVQGKIIWLSLKEQLMLLFGSVNLLALYQTADGMHIHIQ